ncbi:MAG: RICIN domain-containing protein [Candidatus Acidiferrales bacterium]
MHRPVCAIKMNGNATQVQLPSGKSKISWWTGLTVCLVSLFLAPLVRAQVAQPPEPVDPSPINGETYYLINENSSFQMDLNSNSTTPGDIILQNTRSFTNLSQRWAFTKAPDGNWKISNIANGLCLDASTSNGSPVTVQNTCGINISTQEWIFTYITNGYNTITNAGTGDALDVTGSSMAAGTPLNQTPLSGSLSQKWLFRPVFWRGDDMSTGEKEEYDRSADTCANDGGSVGVGTCNDFNFPWWHDAYLPGQDILQIYKNAGLNSIRIRPASINTTIVHGNVSYTTSDGPYSGYTLNAGTSTTFPLTAVSQLIAATSTADQNVAMSDWAAVDLAQRAKKLGMSVFLDLFYDGDNSSDSPGNWSTATLQSLEGSPENENGGNGQNLMYNYVKQEIELFRANGAMPDMVALGNEVNLGMFTSLDKVNYTPNSSQSAAIQIAGMQAVLDASSDASNPGLLGAPVAPPLRCMDIDGTPDLQQFFYAATVTYQIPLDTACQSYYPGWGGPMTTAQYNYVSCGNNNCKGPWHVEEADILAETNLGVTGIVSPTDLEGAPTSEPGPAVGLPVYNAEAGVAYTNIGGDTPLDDWYGSYLDITPNPASSQIARQSYIDLETVQENNPYHLGMGIDCWSCESTPLSSDGGLSNGLLSSTNGGAGSDWGGVYEYWKSAQEGLFDNSNSITPGTGPGDMALDNATLPTMLGLGGRTDPTHTYMFVNATNGGILETYLASTAPSAPLDAATYNGVVSQHQQWQILAQGGDAELNAAIYTCTTSPCSSNAATKAKTGTTLMDHLGDGYFQIVNQNLSGGGVNVLDSEGGAASGSPVYQNTETVAPTSITGTNASQEWDIMTVGNCGDIPANCVNPPLTGQGDYYMIVNKNSGLVLALAGSQIQEQTPAAASNGDWMVPANQGQLWQIVPVHISAASTPATLVFGSGTPTSVPDGGNLGTINVNVENTVQALIASPTEAVTLTITGPGGFDEVSTVTSSAAVASFNLSGVVVTTPGVYSLSATASGLKSATGTLSVIESPTVVLTTTTSLAMESGSYVATITVTNSGTGPADNVHLTAATLGSVTGSALPRSLGTIAANGGSATVTVTFSASAGSPGTRSVESYSGTYSGGTFNAGVRVVLP